MGTMLGQIGSLPGRIGAQGTALIPTTPLNIRGMGSLPTTITVMVVGFAMHLIDDHC